MNRLERNHNHEARRRYKANMQCNLDPDFASVQDAEVFDMLAQYMAAINVMVRQMPPSIHTKRLKRLAQNATVNVNGIMPAGSIARLQGGRRQPGND